MPEDIEKQSKSGAEKPGELGRPALAALSTISIFMTTGVLVYHHLEDWTWIQCAYFSASTLATVGYGDIAPTSDGSRLFTVFFILTGVSSVVSSLGIIGGRYVSRRSRKIAARVGKD